MPVPPGYACVVGGRRMTGIIGTSDSAVIRLEVKRILTTGLTIVWDVPSVVMVMFQICTLPDRHP